MVVMAVVEEEEAWVNGWMDGEEGGGHLAADDALPLILITTVLQCVSRISGPLHILRLHDGGLLLLILRLGLGRRAPSNFPELGHGCCPVHTHTAER